MLVLRDAAGAELNTLSYSVAGQANLSRSLERNTELQVQLDKPAYSGGDTIAVSIRAPYVGAGLITIERERVFHHQWFKTTTTSSVQRITLPADFEGNGYVSVQFLRDPASDELFMSPLSYGVAPFGAEPRGAHAADHADGAAPGEARRDADDAARRRRAVAGRGAGRRRGHPAGRALPESRIRSASSSRSACSRSRRRQILDLILPDFKRFLALAAPGGDADGGFARHLNPFNRKRKPPVAYWSGVVDVGPSGRELRYTVPDYFNGRLRIVAIGASARPDGRGRSRDRSEGRLHPDAERAGDGGARRRVHRQRRRVQQHHGRRAVRFASRRSSGRACRSSGPASVDLQIADKKEGVGEFRVKANAVLGAASLTFIARRGTAEARIEESVSVRPAVAFRTQLTLGRVGRRQRGRRR